MQPNATDTNLQTAIKPHKQGAFEQYITWRALGGIIIDEENEESPNHADMMNFKEFCSTFKVNRSTVYRWKINTPDLAQRIEARRLEVIPLSRVTAVWNANFLTAIQTKDRRAAVEAQKVFLGHFGNLQLPAQREVHEIGEGFADLIQAARNRIEPTPKEPIEGEVVNDAPNQ